VSVTPHRHDRVWKNIMCPLRLALYVVGSTLVYIVRSVYTTDTTTSARATDAGVRKLCAFNRVKLIYKRKTASDFQLQFSNTWNFVDTYLFLVLFDVYTYYIYIYIY